MRTDPGPKNRTVAFFPGKYAARREKPYYDEVLAKLLAANRNMTPGVDGRGPAAR